MRARVLRIMTSVILLGLLTGWAIALRPQGLGGSVLYVVVRGDSMEPAIESGDLLIMRDASSYGVGDVVAYRVPDGDIGAGAIVLHRIVGGNGTDGYVLQGDGNPAPDPWSPTAGDIAATSWIRVPGLGNAFAFVHQPTILASLAAAIVVALFVWRGPGATTEQPERGRLLPRWFVARQRPRERLPH